MFEEVLVSNVACRLWSLLHDNAPATKDNLNVETHELYSQVVCQLAGDSDFQQLVVLGFIDESQAKGEAAARRLQGLEVEIHWDPEPGQVTS